VIEGIRQLRESNKISLKTPLKCAKIISKNEAEITKYLEDIKAECNLLEVVFCKEENYQFRESAKPNFSKICGEDKDLKKEKISYIRNIKKEELDKLLKEGKIRVEYCLKEQGSKGKKACFDITQDEILYTREVVGEEGKYKSFGEFSVILDLCITEDLVERKEAREFNSFVQKMRKKACLKVEDYAAISVENRELANLANRFYKLNIGEGKGEVLGEDVFCYKGENVSVFLYK
jgi:isoleucyl-tRNA synthetase